MFFPYFVGEKNGAFVLFGSFSMKCDRSSLG